MADVIVVGAGLAGLAAALQAESVGVSAIVLEAEDQAGGLARSFQVGEYTFDCSGHLLHLAKEETRALVAELTSPADWLRVQRRAAVWVRDRLVPYPFQLHLAYAPADVRELCLSTLPDKPCPVSGEPAQISLARWIDASLGDGIGKTFMNPYTEKIAMASVSDLTCEWLGRFVPSAPVDAIREGALSKRLVTTGYNQSFSYPVNGGIQLLWRSLASRLVNIRTRAKVVEIDTSRRSVTTEAGKVYKYRGGVFFSAPLNDIAGIVVPRNRTLRLGSRLRANVVTCVNLGVKRVGSAFEGIHWVYLPGGSFSAYRVGFYDHIAPSMAPPDRRALYVEFAHNGQASDESLVRIAVRDLVAIGVLAGAEDVEVAYPVRLSPAYVIPDRWCALARMRLHDELAGRGLHAIGRYARWEYSAMEDALWQGLDSIKRFVASEPMSRGVAQH